MVRMSRAAHREEPAAVRVFTARTTSRAEDEGTDAPRRAGFARGRGGRATASRFGPTARGPVEEKTGVAPGDRPRADGAGGRLARALRFGATAFRTNEPAPPDVRADDCSLGEARQGTGDPNRDAPDIIAARGELLLAATPSRSRLPSDQAPLRRSATVSPRLASGTSKFPAA